MVEPYRALISRSRLDVVSRTLLTRPSRENNPPSRLPRGWGASAPPPPTPSPPMAPLVNGTRRVLTNAPPAVPAKEAAAIERGPLTRRQHSLARTRRENETRSLLLQLHDDVLERILGFLEGRDLAVLECACTHFRYGSFVPANKEALPETSAKRKLEAMELGLMPPGFRCDRPPKQHTLGFPSRRDARRFRSPPMPVTRRDAPRRRPSPRPPTLARGTPGDARPRTHPPDPRAFPTSRDLRPRRPRRPSRLGVFVDTRATSRRRREGA